MQLLIQSSSYFSPNEKNETSLCIKKRSGDFVCKGCQSVLKKHLNFCAKIRRFFPIFKEGKIDKVAKSVYNYGFKVTPFAHVLEKKSWRRAEREILSDTWKKKLGKMSLKSSCSTFNFLLLHYSLHIYRIGK